MWRSRTPRVGVSRSAWTFRPSVPFKRDRGSCTAFVSRCRSVATSPREHLIARPGIPSDERLPTWPGPSFLKGWRDCGISVRRAPRGSLLCTTWTSPPASSLGQQSDNRGSSSQCRKGSSSEGRLTGGPEQPSKACVASADRAVDHRWPGHQPDHAAHRQEQDLPVALAGAVHARRCRPAVAR